MRVTPEIQGNIVPCFRQAICTRKVFEKNLFVEIYDYDHQLSFSCEKDIVHSTVITLLTSSSVFSSVFLFLSGAL